MPDGWSVEATTIIVEEAAQSYDINSSVQESKGDDPLYPNTEAKSIPGIARMRGRYYSKKSSQVGSANHSKLEL